MKNLGFTIFVSALLATSCSIPSSKTGFVSNWNPKGSRIWIGPEYWTNPMQDWKVEQGRLKCLVAGTGRSIHLLSHCLEGVRGDFESTVVLGLPATTSGTGAAGWGGFILGAKGEFNDYRDDAVYGKGINAGISTAGRIFIGNVVAEDNPDSVNIKEELASEKGIKLSVKALAAEDGIYTVTLTAYSNATKKSLAEISTRVSDTGLTGNIALQSHFNSAPGALRDKQGYWFEGWTASGGRLAEHPDRSFGPVLFTLYTLSRDVMKLTAQMPPLAASDQSFLTLEIMQDGRKWEKAGESAIDPLSRTAVFRIEKWNSATDIPYRVVYSWSHDGKRPRDYYYEGTIKKDPEDREEIIVAAFTGNNDLGFPNKEVSDHVMKHKPDLLVYTGDQIYEPRGGFGITMEPLETAVLDYLRKWYMFGWEYGSMLRQIPSVCLPDDHDVYHGNLWGCGGKAAKKSDDTKEWQDDGGYKMPAEWVNMVQRTQTAHMPDPYDPTPVLQGISVYYTDYRLGGISFAIVEDRKWKSAPKALLPASLRVINGWAESSRLVDPSVLDVPAELLGERQLSFLENWAGDWSGRTIFKAVISQTIFCTVATLPDSAQSDVVVSRLRITEKDEYPANDIPTQDMDSDGWPRQGRDAALRVMRKAFAVHIAGDQHLASTVKYGIENWGDSPYAICVPSISNYFPRRWFPNTPGRNRAPGQPENTGDFLDGFGNKMTVLAVANPMVSGMQPAKLYDRSAGYGIIRFNKNTREIEMANWPRQTDPSAPGAKPYQGWPVRFMQEDNYSRKAAYWLPELEINGTDLPPVVKITNEETGELVYALRIRGNKFRPGVFEEGTYMIEAGEPGTDKWKVLKNISPENIESRNNLRIDLQ